MCGSGVKLSTLLDRLAYRAANTVLFGEGGGVMSHLILKLFIVAQATQY
jgi:hypothetical protein